MRENQISVRIRRTGGQVPDGFKPPDKKFGAHTWDYGDYLRQKDNGIQDFDEYLRQKKAEGQNEPVQHIDVYADANNFYETWCAAFNETVQEIQRHDVLSYGEKTSLGLNEVIITVNFANFNNKEFEPVDWLKNKVFKSESKNIYEAVTNAFNDILFHLQKHIKLPSFGRKEHYPGSDERIRVIAGFAGVGKSTFAAQNPENFVDFVLMPYKYYLSDIDNPGEQRKANLDDPMREDYPYNYVDAIVQALAESDKTLVIPSDAKVLRQLRFKDIPYLLCYPVREAKEVYRERFINRGNTEEFLRVFIDHWDSFMDTLENDHYGFHKVMSSEQYLSDVINAEKDYYR